MRTERFRGVLLASLIIASLMSLLLISAKAAWGQDIEWIRQFGTSDSDGVSSVAVDGSGNVYVAGRTSGAFPGQTSSGRSDVFVRKYDGSGSELWTRQFGTSGYDSAHDVAVDGSGNVYVAGFTLGAFPGQTSSGAMDVFVRKYDGSGSEIWTRQFGTSDSDEVPRVAADTSGNVYVAGGTENALPGQTFLGYEDAFVRKYDGSGNELWTRQFGTSGYDSAHDVAVDGSGNVYVAGGTTNALPGQTDLGGTDAFLVKFGEAAPTDYTPYLVGGAVAIVMIGIVAALYMRRRKPQKLFFGS